MKIHLKYDFLEIIVNLNFRINLFSFYPKTNGNKLTILRAIVILCYRTIFKDAAIKLLLLIVVINYQFYHINHLMYNVLIFHPKSP